MIIKIWDFGSWQIMYRINMSNHSLYMHFIMIILVLSNKREHYVSFGIAKHDLLLTEVIGPEYRYCETSNISRTLLGNKTVDHSDVVGASPPGAAPTTSSFST